MVALIWGYVFQMLYVLIFIDTGIEWYLDFGICFSNAILFWNLLIQG